MIPIERMRDVNKSSRHLPKATPVIDERESATFRLCNRIAAHRFANLPVRPA